MRHSMSKDTAFSGETTVLLSLHFFVTACNPGGVLPYMGYIGMCRREGYGFQAVYSRIGYINQNVWL